MIPSIGVTAPVLVLEEARLRRLAFKTAIDLCLLAVLGRGINVMVSGAVDWNTWKQGVGKELTGGGNQKIVSGTTNSATLQTMSALARKPPTPASAKGEPILLCMDMDRTALPNGPQEESPQARERLRRVASHPELTIAYVSGRRKELQIEAIKEYDLPQPLFGVADVGTSIYEVTDGEWRALSDWKEEISRCWQGRTADAIRNLLRDRAELQLQEIEAQGDFKLSYFAAADLNHTRVVRELQEQLRPAGFRSSIIWSVDETTDTGLLDILPEEATKLHAVKFLMKRVGVNPRRMVYAGDSGNDLPVLTSGLQSVLVANAIPEVREAAITGAPRQNGPGPLHVARGGFMGMNGNYAAGILEGLAHFVPETRRWME